MLGILIILAFASYIYFLHPIFKPKTSDLDPKKSTQIKKLWSIAQTSMKDRKPLRAEKALLMILKFDEKNAAAYNRLGILYAKEQQYSEAIECFEIAQSLDSNASSLHNAGLIYLETGAYEKASMAFSQALKLEGDLPARYIALAKSEEKLGNYEKSLEALESAYELDRATSTLRQILALYELTGNQEGISTTKTRIEEQLKEKAKKLEKSHKKSLITSHPKLAKKPTRIFYPKSKNPENSTLKPPKNRLFKNKLVSKTAIKSTQLPNSTPSSIRPKPTKKRKII